MKRIIRGIMAMFVVTALLMSHRALAETQTGTLRVCLKSLGTTTQLKINLLGSYSLDNDGAFRFDSGTSVSVRVENNALLLTCGGLTLNRGDHLTLTRHQSEEPSGLIIAGSPKGNLYCGSLSLGIQDGALMPILIIDVEEYLKGVVPYEMSDSFPFEALKAQAVAARTYALQRRDARKDAPYDLVDTPADQVYCGLDDSFRNAVGAVEATKGLCGLYDGSYALCYYTATNGGQTALARDVLGTANADYLTVRDDPYDLENPSSPVRTLTVSKDASDLPDVLMECLLDTLPEQLGTLGYSDEAEDIEIEEILSLSPHDPIGGGENRMFRSITVSYTVRGRRVQPLYESTVSPDRETPRRIGFIAGEWETIETPFTCEWSIYDLLKNRLDLGLSRSDCELTDISEDDTRFIIQLRRYGHGVGMSQRGAQVMAGTYGMSCADILSFYYPGLTFETLTLIDETPSSETLTVSAPINRLPEPREGEISAVVCLSSGASRLNVRKEPSTDAEIIGSLGSGAEILVSSLENGWAAIRTDKLTGFVADQYLSIDE